MTFKSILRASLTFGTRIEKIGLLVVEWLYGVLIAAGLMLVGGVCYLAAIGETVTNSISGAASGVVAVLLIPIWVAPSIGEDLFWYTICCGAIVLAMLSCLKFVNSAKLRRGSICALTFLWMGLGGIGAHYMFI